MRIGLPAGAEITRRIVTFGRVLREGGLEVGPGRLQNALQALDAVDLTLNDDVYWALRCTLVSRHEDIETFDDAFAAFWQRARRTTVTEPRTAGIDASDEDPRLAAAEQDGQSARGEGGDQAEETAQERAATQWSADELLRELDFELYGEEELRRARALTARIARASPRRRTRRLEAAHAGRQLDPRRTFRSAVRTGGAPIEREWRRPKLVPRKLVYLVDISGSMEPYARPLVVFLQAAVQAGRHVEAFTFGTRLTRLTPHLTGHDPDRALDRAARAVPDWAGGTRIGENLRAFNNTWGRRGLTRGATVVIVSDGWERGDVDLLRAAMEWLSRTAHRIVWVNPLAGEPSYRPLVGGMLAALPSVDVFLPGHNLRSLETLARVLEELDARPVRPG